MKILLLGAGGREHALAWKLAQSPRCEHLFIAPGNAGTAALGTNVRLSLADFPAIGAFCQRESIGMVVVGPEQPLVDGIADYLQALGIPVIGPSRAAARLEGSKQFAKDFMQRYGIPTAQHASFSTHQIREAMEYIAAHPLPVVVKASGLAAGKGVVICQSREDAAAEALRMLDGSAFGAAGREVVIESFLEGIEVSVFVLTDGRDYVLLPPAKDYKRIGEGDTGPNTGGMGAVSPVPFADADLMARIEEQAIRPTLRGIQAEGLDYTGFIFFGFMISGGQPYLLEYNVRMGDPETEVVMPRLRSDLVELFEAALSGRLGGVQPDIDPRVCATVMMVSGGYPGAYDKGKAITGLEHADPDAMIFHAGTRLDDVLLLTDGGRVLACSAYGSSIPEAVSQALAQAGQIQFEGAYFRRDIGQDLMR